MSQLGLIQVKTHSLTFTYPRDTSSTSRNCTGWSAREKYRLGGQSGWWARLGNILLPFWQPPFRVSISSLKIVKLRRKLPYFGVNFLLVTETIIMHTGSSLRLSWCVNECSCKSVILWMKMYNFELHINCIYLEYFLLNNFLNLYNKYFFLVCHYVCVCVSVCGGQSFYLSYLSLMYVCKLLYVYELQSQYMLC